MPTIMSDLRQLANQTLDEWLAQLARVIRRRELWHRPPCERRRTRQTRVPGRTPDADGPTHCSGLGDDLDMDRIVRLVQLAGVRCCIERTGGNVATIFAGALQPRGPSGPARYAAAAGPGSFGEGEQPSRAVTQEFCVGPDDDGEADLIDVAALGAYTEHQVAWLIVAQSRADDPRAPLSTDEVDALGLDGTGRGRSC